MAVLLVNHADVIELPGAKISTTEPKLEKEERASVEVVEPTVMASGVLAGDEVEASVLLFPAATHITIPSVMALLTASSVACDAPPPNDILPTAGLVV